ncbi:hypothetical protein [Microbacterium sp. PF5]|uniref:hypothetical protein n=1 Tax=Microbacterium sp. PF5 TaxID=2305435 RepID=UPI00109BB4CD|nr:hypothetical protein [Microbacterium sp. PF5]
MSADILSDPTHPHGTSEGYQRGCRGSHCPAPITCRDFRIRYQGDYAFRKQIDAGVSAANIIAGERERAAQLTEAERQARRARGGPRSGASVGDRRAAANRARAGEAVLIARDTLRAMLKEGLTDRQIADRLGLLRRQVTGTRNAASLPRNPDQNRRPVPTEAPVPAGASALKESA